MTLETVRTGKVARRLVLVELVATVAVAPELLDTPKGLDTVRVLVAVAAGIGRCLMYASTLRSLVDSWEGAGS